MSEIAMTISVDDLDDVIRSAMYGRDVREALAQACEYAATVYNTALKAIDRASIAETKTFLGITH